MSLELRMIMAASKPRKTSKKPVIKGAQSTKEKANVSVNLNKPAPLVPKPVDPLQSKAIILVAKGDPVGAAEALLELSAQVVPLESAQLICRAAELLKLSNIKRAIELATQATKIEPGMAFTWICLSFIHFHAKNINQSRDAALKAIGLKIQPQQRVDLGRHLSALGGADKQALETVKQGYQESGEMLSLASYTLRVALQSADWALSSTITQRLKAAHDAGQTKDVAETPRTHLLWCADEATNIKVISAFAEKNYPIQAPMIVNPYPDSTQRKLRIGYLSSDFRDHATSLLALGMMRYHDKERFEFYGYCSSYDDGSALRREMLNRFNRARSISKLNDKAAASLIHADKIDILVDLNGLTDGSRHGVLAWRPAPIQISYLGFPGTAGGRFVDYIIGDDITVPKGEESSFPEKIIRIPPTYQINDYQTRFLPPPCKYAATGLPDGKLVVGMFNNINKVGPEVWATWLEILRLVPNAVLWLLDPGEVAKSFLTQSILDAGIEPGRIFYAPKRPQEAHIARLQHCTIVLDPWPYGGHTTTGDAIFAGVPVIALDGTNFASRVSGGLIRAAGMGMLVRSDIPSYIETAVSLLNRPDEVLKIKNFLVKNRRQLPVFDARLRTMQLEAAYLAVQDKALKGNPPDHIRVDITKNDNKKMRT